jgi:hypothetical protein
MSAGAFAAKYKMDERILVAVLTFILVAVLALVLAAGGALASACMAPPEAKLGGGEYHSRHTREVHPEAGDPHAHGLGAALHEYARGLGPADVVAAHPTRATRYEPLRVGGKKAKPWTDYATWGDLKRDPAATDAYMEQRAAVLNNPNLDWTQVTAAMAPKLLENREYIGIANLEPDGRTMRLVAAEASPTAAGDDASGITFASIPEELVVKYASRPGLVLFHTHPADPRGSPLPSSQDIATAIYLGATARFAACAVVSRYGVIMFGLDWSGYRAIHTAKDWTLAVMNMSHDVVAAHEAIRSWSMYTIPEYLAFYPRHRLLLVAYPSPEMVGESRFYSYLWSLETPVDTELIADLREDSRAHRRHGAPRSRNEKKSATFAPKPEDISLRFD